MDTVMEKHTEAVCVCARARVHRYHLLSGTPQYNFQLLFRLFPSSSSVVSDSIVWPTRLFSAESDALLLSAVSAFSAGSPSRNESALHTLKSHLTETRGGVLTLFRFHLLILCLLHSLFLFFLLVLSWHPPHHVSCSFLFSYSCPSISYFLFFSIFSYFISYSLLYPFFSSQFPFLYFSSSACSLPSSSLSSDHIIKCVYASVEWSFIDMYRWTEAFKDSAESHNLWP